MARAPPLKTRTGGAKSPQAPPAAQVRGAFFYPQASRREVAKVSPGEFMRQVRAETAKVHWPTRKETVATAIMVMIGTLSLAFFFFGVDAAFSSIVKFLLSFLG
jgi:preprotein translocase subunit SecE